MMLNRTLLLLVLLIAPGALPADGSTDLEGHLEAGERALAAREWSGAEMSFRRAIGTARESVAAQAGLARALAGGGSTDAAVQGIVQVAERWVRGGGYAEAEELLETGLELAPDNPRMLVLLGRARVLDRKYLAAEKPLARVYERGEADLEALLYYGATLWENGRLEAAERALRQAVSGSDGAFPARYQLGRLLLWVGRYAEAAELLTSCAAQAPQAADVQLDLARALDAAGRTEEAITVFRRAVSLAPEHSEMRYGLAMALSRAGDREGARSELATYGELYEREQRQTMQAGLEQARIARGREMVRQGRAGEAVEYLRELPASADSLAALAAALRAGDDLDGAAEQLSRAIALDPERADLRALLNETRLELLRRP